MRKRIVSWLLRLYPKVWRNEYGAELADMLRARPLTAGVCSDVVFSAMWQRARATQASTWVGLGLMFAVIAAIVSNIASAPAYQESVLLDISSSCRNLCVRSSTYSSCVASDSGPL